jgi:hypothetical protein
MACSSQAKSINCYRREKSLDFPDLRRDQCDNHLSDGMEMYDLKPDQDVIVLQAARRASASRPLRPGAVDEAIVSPPLNLTGKFSVSTKRAYLTRTTDRRGKRLSRSQSRRGAQGLAALSKDAAEGLELTAQILKKTDCKRRTFRRRIGSKYDL